MSNCSMIKNHFLRIVGEKFFLQDTILPVDADKLLDEGAMDRDDEAQQVEDVHVRNPLDVLDVVLYG